jgi:uncharacterized protein
MSIATANAAIYEGTVVHVRLRPRRHRLCYRVFSLLVDVDHIGEACVGCRLVSHNRFNLFSIHDRDHGRGDGTPLGIHARRLLAEAGIDIGTGRIQLLAYPRILGAVFNPLSVYYARFQDGRLAGLIYEVNNTFGERRSYVVHAGEANGGVYAQGCAKELYVSPFAPASGRYGFRVTAPGDQLLLGVQFHDDQGALIRTHFKATATAVSDRSLLRLACRYPLLTLKVVGGIHYEALKLWLKGTPVVRRPRSPRYSVTIVDSESP